MIKKGDYVVCINTADIIFLSKKIYYVYGVDKEFIYINDDLKTRPPDAGYFIYRFRKMTKKEIKSRSTEIIILKLKGKL